jgi:hypothetical protein
MTGWTAADALGDDMLAAAERAAKKEVVGGVKTPNQKIHQYTIRYDTIREA